MGISDRDYARPDAAKRTLYAPRSEDRGFFRTVNGWLIAINIAVFILNNLLLANAIRQTPYGVAVEPGVSSAELARAQLDRSTLFAFPNQPGVFFQNLVDPQTNKIVARQRYTRQPALESWGHFSTGKFYSDGQVWRVLSFQFLHAGPIHLLFNMLGLFFVGGLVERHLGARKYAVFYLLCGVAGSLLFMLLNLLGYLTDNFLSPGLSLRLPFLLFTDVYTPLVGASAGVFGVLLAAAFIAPRAIVDVAFIIPMKMKTAVYLFLALAILNLFVQGKNAGGDAAHVGGALAGAWLIRRTDLLAYVGSLFGLLPDRASPKRTAQGPKTLRPPPDDPEVDRILDKVKASGIDSLSDAERATLRGASRR
jgi:membrane associated rhomboid family serine protease